MLKNQLLCCWAIGFLLASEVTVNLTANSGSQLFNLNREALARSSGGSSGGRSSSSSSSSNSNRSSSSNSSTSSNSRPNNAANSNPSRPSNSGNTGGRVRTGSFEKPAAPTPVAVPSAPIPQQSGNNRTVIIQQRTYNSGPSYVVPYNSGNNQQNTGSNNQQPAVNPAPITTDSNSDRDPSSESSEDAKWFWFWLFVSVGTLALIAYCIYYYRPKSHQETKTDIFAVKKLQVAMLAEARQVQQQLNELTLKSDVESVADRAEVLQEAVLIVLRSPESWTHCVASYQTVANLEEAAQIFNQISIQERSKFSVETLSMVNGDIRSRPSVSAEDEGPGEYIVVTFVMGTKNAKPLVGDIRDVGKLKAVLERMAATPADNLLTLEVIWSPQQETDSLTADDLLSSYADLIRVG
ncbi:DUF1517 domain-containing protein [Microcoleus sp. bin38.metabat.b11b12b14.051]|uniref:DUF1517 domain-containing protein n=1 Tax=Microcoleus sp. bin38.metabat.b11b12b14.051 TaxID=2742709 RepID=UPI0025E240B5|nr:DUF1517 domain-containing protein [Microcoleus sp. bin38.metabat.b11b12b14.051]